jgi:hypothetical protein
MARRKFRTVGSWHKVAIDSVAWKVRKGSIRPFAVAPTNDCSWHKTDIVLFANDVC